MTYWTYRVMRKPINNEFEYGIYEVYMDEDNNIQNWTEESVAPWGDTPEELSECLKMFALALTKPILDYRDGTEIKEATT